MENLTENLTEPSIWLDEQNVQNILELTKVIKRMAFEHAYKQAREDKCNSSYHKLGISIYNHCKEIIKEIELFKS